MSCEHVNTDTAICGQCAGSGEGMYDGTVCMRCNGDGEDEEGYYS